MLIKQLILSRVIVLSILSIITKSKIRRCLSETNLFEPLTNKPILSKYETNLTSRRDIHEKKVSGFYPGSIHGACRLA
jgi:hypothetical protein